MTTPLSHVDIDGQQIAYLDHGATDGRTIVFAHAMGLDHSIWDGVVGLLPPNLRVVRYDLRGHGASSTPPAPYTMGSLVRDAELLLDHLHVRDCVFVGSSIGGMVAQALAVKRLDQIRGLVLTNTVTKIGTKETWAKLMENIKAKGLEAQFETDLTQNFSMRFRKTTEINQWAALLRTQRLDGFLGCAAALSGTDFYTTTASLRLPSLIVASTEDAITPADMVRELAGLIPGAAFHLIRKSGHLPMIEQPAAFATALGDFLRTIGHV